MINLPLMSQELTGAYNAGILQGMAYKTLQVFLTKALHPFNLSIPEWKLLGQLYDYKELRVADLASFLGYDPPLVTTLIDSLLKKKLLKRKVYEKDRRVKHIIPTKKTLELIPKIEPEVRSIVRALFSGISQEELFIYMKVLETVVRNGKK